MRQRLRYIIVCTVHIFIFLVNRSIMINSKDSKGCYTGENTIQPIQYLLPYSGHTCVDFGMVLHDEAIPGDDLIPWAPRVHVIFLSCHVTGMSMPEQRRPE
jgi:hypothetical protein